MVAYLKLYKVVPCNSKENIKLVKQSRDAWDSHKGFGVQERYANHTYQWTRICRSLTLRLKKQ